MTQHVIDYFTATDKDYLRFWSGNNDLAMHFGYYDKTVTSHTASLLKMNEKLADLITITKKDRVLDAGCGFGGSCFWLAQHRGCLVTGITIVPEQYAFAKKEAEENNINKKVTFLLGDYAHLPVRRNSYTVFWGLESICHAQNKEQVIKEAYRVLRSKGKILISEYMLREKPTLSKKEKILVQKVLEGWAMPSLLTISEYTSLLKKYKFRNIHIYDFTENITPSFNKLGKLRLPTLPTSYVIYPFLVLAQKLGLLETIRVKNIQAGMLHNKALKNGIWRYCVITAEK